MRVRLKFSKYDELKFVGHLDTVRLFQRAIKVAQIPIAYSQGFNPHSRVYFAMPLSVGVSSTGEYMDIITQTDVIPLDLFEKLNCVLPEGIAILEAFEVPDKSPTLMSLVGEADYDILLDQHSILPELHQKMNDNLAKESLVTIKKGKKKSREVDIKPMIKSYHWTETTDELIFSVRLAAGSMENLSPDLVMQVLTEGTVENYDYKLIRRELYTLVDDEVIALKDYDRC